SNHVAGSGVGDCHDLVVADTEEPVVRSVDGQAGRLGTRGEGPPPGYPLTLGIYLGDLPAVLDVDVQLTVPPTHPQLGFASERHGADRLAGRRVNHTRRAGFAIEREHVP